MKLDLKQKLLAKIATLTENDIVHEPVYKCVNDGMVCFNGMVAELVNGCKYDPEDRRSEMEDRLYEDAQQEQIDELIREKRSELDNVGLNENEIQNVIDRMLGDGDFDTDVEIYEDVEHELKEAIADDIIADLSEIYDHGNLTRKEIDEFHVAWTDGTIDFDVAVAEVERIITENE